MIPSPRSPGDSIPNLNIGRIIEVNGIRIVAELDPKLKELSRVFAGETYPIGQFGSIVRIHFGRRLLYAHVTRLRMKTEYEAERGVVAPTSSDERVIEADLFGEGEWISNSDGTSDLHFERGVGLFPLPLQTVYLTPKSELRAIYGRSTDVAIQLGEHVGAGGAPCYADINELFGKHTAILGSTGSGKSAAVAAIVHKVLDRGRTKRYNQWSPQIIVLDPHNEYGEAFDASERLSTDEGSLSLPYWLLDLEESVGLFIGKTESAATSQSNIIKKALTTVRTEVANQHTKLGLQSSRLTVDSPVPYKLGNPLGLDEFGKRDGQIDTTGLVGAINAQRPSNENKGQHESFNKVLGKIESFLKDDRLSFMSREWEGNDDPMPRILEQLLGKESSVKVVDLSGVPNEVAGIASAVIARTLFSMKVWQSDGERRQSPILLICEEAHRYVPNSGEAQYVAAQNAIKRIAKEGRKYGIGLLLVSQRPSEVDATVLSQCNSWVVLRITNEADSTHVRGVLPDAMSGLTKMLSGLRRREAVFVGSAAMLPSRILIEELPSERLPKSSDIDFDKGWQTDGLSLEMLETISRRWRYQERDSS